MPQENNNQSIMVEIKGYNSGLQIKRPERRDVEGYKW
jgi:hypothetical protein